MPPGSDSPTSTGFALPRCIIKKTRPDTVIAKSDVQFRLNHANMRLSESIVLGCAIPSQRNIFCPVDPSIGAMYAGLGRRRCGNIRAVRIPKMRKCSGILLNKDSTYIVVNL